HIFFALAHFLDFSWLIPGHKPGGHGKLGCRQTHGLLGHLLRNAFHFEQNLAGFDYRNPSLRRALAFSHTSLRRLLGNRLVGEYADPDLPAALDKAGHGDTRCFDLAIGDPTTAERFQSELSERERRSAPGFTFHADALLLAELDLFRHQHSVSSLLVQPAGLLSAAGVLLASLVYSLDSLSLDSLSPGSPAGLVSFAGADGFAAG